MKIAGIGILSCHGVGMAAFEHALRSGWQKPGMTQAHWLQGGNAPAFRVDFSSVPDRALLKKIRRSDGVSKMSVLAAADALADCGIEDITRKRIGIILATAFGPHVTTFHFLDDIIDHGDPAVSPTTFSNSVHNAAASYISMALSIQGPTLTVSQFRFSFPAALQVAKAWLDQGRCDYILAGAVDEYGDVLGYVADHKLTTAPDGRIKPFSFSPTCQVPGEGAVFFLLTNEDVENGYCGISGVRLIDDPDRGKKVDIDIIDADGMLPDESAYRASLMRDVPVAAYSPLVGSMMISGAFNMAAGALMLKNQMHYAVPVQDNPQGVSLLAETGAARVDSIRCTGYNCYAEPSVVYLERA